MKERAPLLKVRVPGEPGASGSAREEPWRLELEAAVAGTAFHPAGAVLSLDLVVPPRPADTRAPAIDQLAEPIIDTLVGRLGWFGGRRPAIAGFWARTQMGPRLGCDIAVFPTWTQVPLGAVPIILDATWTSEAPRSGRDLAFAQWVGRELRALPSPRSRIAVRLAFGGRMNVAELGTGHVKHVLDCLWPVLGGAPGAPDHARISILAATQQDAAAGGMVRITVLSQGQTPPTAVA